MWGGIWYVHMHLGMQHCGSAAIYSTELVYKSDCGFWLAALWIHLLGLCINGLWICLYILNRQWTCKILPGLLQLEFCGSNRSIERLYQWQQQRKHVIWWYRQPEIPVQCYQEVMGSWCYRMQLIHSRLSVNEILFPRTDECHLLHSLVFLFISTGQDL